MTHFQSLFCEMGAPHKREVGIKVAEAVFYTHQLVVRMCS